MSAPYTGGCLCGQVRWKATAEPINVRLCHCRNCQRATGGPFFARAVFLSEQIGWTGEVSHWPSSVRVERLSCARCGTPVFSQPKDPPARLGVALASLDDPKALAPQMHIWVCEKQLWVSLNDGLPQCDRGPV
jgi:hypothetical protein